MLLLLVLYPVVMLLSRFVGPHLRGCRRATVARDVAQSDLQRRVAELRVHAASIRAVPALARSGRRRAGIRPSLIGAVVIVTLYAATMLLFASVHWLQFWDYNQ